MRHGEVDFVVTAHCFSEVRWQKEDLLQNSLEVARHKLSAVKAGHCN